MQRGIPSIGDLVMYRVQALKTLIGGMLEVKVLARQDPHVITA